ncbi:MAG TPA: tetratricopeptide repeat protein, partial [Burkholderiales bacterium]|nr:tetratricopeptide repeat protein [Burkholderiales bacterium]
MKLAVAFSTLAFMAALPISAQAATADDVKALVDQGKAADAYALGRQHPEELGNPAFDFYYGVAAVDSGHAGEGVLALERYVANFPDNQAARLELGRAYFVLGDDVRAREEFDNVQKTNPPANVQAN